MEWIMERFLCCCVNSAGNGDHVGITSDMLGVSSGVSGDSPEAAMPLDSAAPQLLKRQQDTLRTVHSHAQTPRGESYEGAMNTARSNASAGSAMSLEEKEREKAKLQRLVKDFAKEAVTGIAVNLVNPESARMSPHFFQMDRYLTVFSLKPKDGSSAETAVQDFNVKDLTAIYKGAEVCLKAPSLGGSAVLCVGLDTDRADRRLFFHFDEPLERDKFYTCLKILRMSVDIQRS